jgi:Tn3 transposase DDE domain
MESLVADISLAIVAFASTNLDDIFVLVTFFSDTSFSARDVVVGHNIVTLSRALERLHADGLKASDQALAALTPYQTEHIKRFGNYTVNFSRTPEKRKKSYA